jgi:hypothetical protein
VAIIGSYERCMFVEGKSERCIKVSANFDSQEACEKQVQYLNTSPELGIKRVFLGDKPQTEVAMNSPASCHPYTPPTVNLAAWLVGSIFVTMVVWAKVLPAVKRYFR